jgi:hypothetical protein
LIARGLTALLGAGSWTPADRPARQTLAVIWNVRLSLLSFTSAVLAM